MRTIPERLEERKARGRWVPASGGSEQPYKTRSGIRVLYCWNTGTGEHAWLNVDTDIIMTAEEADAAHQWRH
jgi:hypothetical protein